MKFKYFLRGFGIGIIFASIICVVAFQSSDARQISDKEVIERAKELGMVEKEDSAKDMFATDETNVEKQTSEVKPSTEEKTTETSIKEKSTEEEKSTEKKTTEKKTTEEKTTEKKTAEEKTTEEKTTETTAEKKTTVTITIKGGMSSYPICQMLQELGLIEDATDFDNYLIKNGYANRISVGTHTLRMGMSYEEIAVAISDPK